MRIIIFLIVISLTFIIDPRTCLALLPFDQTGNLYVSMWQANEVEIYTPDGQSQGSFTAEGMNGPRGIAFNPANAEIWVAAEFANKIFIFSHDHQFLRAISHEDLNGPVGVAFASREGIDLTEQEVYISNSNANEIMVFNQAGEFKRRFSQPNFNDPNCGAFMGDGSFFVTNRLGGESTIAGALDKFSAADSFEFSVSEEGMSSVMAVARDPNMQGFSDDTVWVTSGSGDRAIYEYDQMGNLLNTVLPNDVEPGSNIVPQGIAFDDEGNFYVVSFGNAVYKFDGEGNFLMKFSTSAGTSRSLAIRGCEVGSGISCTPLGSSSSSSSASSSSSTSSSSSSASSASSSSGMVSNPRSSGGGAISPLFFLLIISGFLGLYARRH